VNSATQNKILSIYDQYHRPEFLEIDPLCVVRKSIQTPDAEWVALVSALCAFGGVKQIIASVQNLTDRLDLDPASSSVLNNWLQQSESDFVQKVSQSLAGFRHRIYVGEDLALLLILYRRSCLAYGSLKNHFLHFHSEKNETVEQGLTGLIAEWKSWAKQIQDQLHFQPGSHFFHMLNSPEDGSTCKRWLMFLKWVVRPNDGLDLGLWAGSPSLRTDQLLIPLDTHLFKISKRLRLTLKKTANFAASLQVTQALKKIDPADPTRFDFSLCRWGMLEYRGNGR
jgi:uncharacterized protein (TIGR02757 family)